MDGAMTPSHVEDYDAALDALNAAKDTWAQTPIADRILLLSQVKDNLMTVADAWAQTATRMKQIPEGSPLSGEEWTSGPYAVMSACNGLILTLRQIENKAFLKNLPKRELTTGQLAVKVMPHSIWDHLLLSGVKAEVWMKKGVSAANLPDHTAIAYDIPPTARKGKVALILGAGNIASIAPLDVFQKLFLENQVVILKMHPVNDYLTEFLEVALKPLIDLDALRIVKGDGASGAYLTTHAIIEELHITGAGATHDAIVWGIGAEGEKNRKANTPQNYKRFTSELGAVCPTIVVPGPWSAADLKFQAEQIATQKLHNSGFNCVACQVLIMPKGWNRAAILMANLNAVAQKSNRGAYYPGTAERLDAFKSKAKTYRSIVRGAAPSLIVNDVDDSDWFNRHRSLWTRNVHLRNGCNQRANLSAQCCRLCKRPALWDAGCQYPDPSQNDQGNRQNAVRKHNCRFALWHHCDQRMDGACLSRHRLSLGCLSRSYAARRTVGHWNGAQHVYAGRHRTRGDPSAMGAVPARAFVGSVYAVAAPAVVHHQQEARQGGPSSHAVPT